MVLVAGSTGFLGREICRRLRDGGVAVRGLVRASSDQAVIATLEAQGVETMVGDVRDYAQDILARA
jgi:nucleoside-diphosphate-sugar epimerase